MRVSLSPGEILSPHGCAFEQSGKKRRKPNMRGSNSKAAANPSLLFSLLLAGLPQQKTKTLTSTVHLRLAIMRLSWRWIERSHHDLFRHGQIAIAKEK
mmetsp:Transcript_28283/g.59158  ORF Transcript_28283/g.59158 Transcript_28283/m.59158 type:complete len:98 (+) Transcript_28283:1104-1397(+)